MATTGQIRRKGAGRRVVAVVAVVLVVAAWSVGGAPAAGASTAWVPIATWEMDQAERALVDTSGNGLHGVVGGRVTTGAAVDGSVAHSFPGSTQADRAVLDLVSGDGTDPKGAEWALNARFRTWQATANIAQKGQAMSVGGFYKLELTGGRAYCVFRGSLGTLATGSTSVLSDGAWHSVRCERHWNWLGMWVDGVFESGVDGRTGYIANDDPFAIGGKANCNMGTVSCDYLTGAVDRVSLERLVTLPDPVPPAPAPAGTVVK